jgi:hypothetical protein
MFLMVVRDAKAGGQVCGLAREPIAANEPERSRLGDGNLVADPDRQLRLRGLG